MKKRIIYKILLAVATTAVLGGMTTLLIAANRKTALQRCAGVHVVIHPGGEAQYVNKDEVILAMEKSNRAALLNQPVQTIDLARLEKVLEADQWIQDAQLYFDSKNNLNVLIRERMPIARVITIAGNSFFIDSQGKQLPLLEDKVVRLQTITGFIAATKWNAADSALFSDVKQVAQYITTDPFWNAQIGQIDITPNQTIELVPVIGDHIIKLGRGENIRDQLSRLLLFYKQVLSKAGFSKYAVLDLQYAGQVVAVKKGKVSAIDSAAFQQKIDALLNKAQEENIAGEFLQDSLAIPGAKLSEPVKSLEKESVPLKTKPAPTMKAITVKEENKSGGISIRPKAVMKGKAD